jgi:thioredoxin-dependent peroxiredoxin
VPTPSTDDATRGRAGEARSASRRPSAPEGAAVIAPGAPAPSFSLPDQHGEQVAVESLRGRPVVVYFYPRDEGRGCTVQACDVRDRWQAFVERGATVLGISADDVGSHVRFAATHGLPHQLLADPGRQVIETYGAWGWRTRSDGTRVLGVRRDTVLIGRDGRVVDVWREVDPETHVDQVLRALDRLDAGPATA